MRSEGSNEQSSTSSLKRRRERPAAQLESESLVFTSVMSLRVSSILIPCSLVVYFYMLRDAIDFEDRKQLLKILMEHRNILTGSVNFRSSISPAYDQSKSFVCYALFL